MILRMYGFAEMCYVFLLSVKNRGTKYTCLVAVEEINDITNSIMYYKIIVGIYILGHHINYYDIVV